MKKYDGYNSSVIHFGFVQKFMDKAIILYYYLIVRRIANNILFDLILEEVSRYLGKQIVKISLKTNQICNNHPYKEVFI